MDVIPIIVVVLTVIVIGGIIERHLAKRDTEQQQPLPFDKTGTE